MKRSLIKRRLIQIKNIEGENCLSLHRSLQSSIRETAAQDSATAQRAFDQALFLIHRAFPASSSIQVPEPTSWRVYQRLMPHVMSLQNAFVEAKSTIQGSEDLASLLSEAATNQWACGFTQDGLTLLTSAEQVMDSIPADVSKLRANMYTCIALMHDNTGISARAEALQRRKFVLEIRRKHTDGVVKVPQVDDILLHNAWLDYGLSLLQHHRYEEFEDILNECLKKYREWGTPDQFPYEYAKYGHKMGLVRMYQNRYDEALQLCREGVEYMANTGNESLMLRFKFDLACLHLQRGEVEASLVMHKDILKQRIIVCGKANENTLQSYYAIGALEQIRGNLAEAE